MQQLQPYIRCAHAASLLAWADAWTLAHAWRLGTWPSIAAWVHTCMADSMYGRCKKLPHR
eukprot:366335-Chlamydomonas_euryale.AAC.2